MDGCPNLRWPLIWFHAGNTDSCRPRFQAILAHSGCSVVLRGRAGFEGPRLGLAVACRGIASTSHASCEAEDTQVTAELVGRAGSAGHQGCRAAGAAAARRRRHCCPNAPPTACPRACCRRCGAKEGAGGSPKRPKGPYLLFLQDFRRGYLEVQLSSANKPAVVRQPVQPSRLLFRYSVPRC